MLKSRQWTRPTSTSSKQWEVPAATIIPKQIPNNICMYANNKTKELIKTFHSVAEAIKYLMADSNMRGQMYNRVSRSIRDNLNLETKSSYGYIFMYKSDGVPLTKEMKEAKVVDMIAGVRATNTKAKAAKIIREAKANTAPRVVGMYTIKEYKQEVKCSKDVAKIATLLAKERGIKLDTVKTSSERYGEYLVNVYPKFLLDEVVQMGYTLSIDKGA